jgi:transcriptional regulator with XRE-family HTH domain
MGDSVHPIRAYRLGKNPPITLEALAKRVRTTKPNLSRIETGKQMPSDELLSRLVTETGIPARLLRPDLAKLFTAASRPRARTRARVAA